LSDKAIISRCLSL